jgi:hypothetical protein
MSRGTKYNAFALRMAKKAAGSMPDSLFIQTGTEATDARGFSSTGFADSGAAIPCRVEGQVGREVVVDGRVQSIRLYRIRIIAVRDDGSAITVEAKQRARIVARGALAERILDIQEVGEREGVSLDIFGSIVKDS